MVQQLSYRVPSLHAGQRQVRAGARRVNLLCAGRFWRKTSLAMRLSLDSAISGAETLWGAPTLEQGRIGWEELLRACGGLARLKYAPPMEATIPPGNGKIRFVSLDSPHHARGRHPQRIVIDEAPYVEEGAWEQVLLPMVTGQSEVWLIGTPCGRNWFWRLWEMAREREDIACFQAPTLGCEVVDGQLTRKSHPLENPEYRWEDLQFQFDLLPEDVFRQEFMAEWVEGGGVVFADVDLLSTHKVEPPADGGEYIYGIDWGKYQDFTVFSILDAAHSVQVYIERSSKADYQYQLQRLGELCRSYPPSVLVVEANAMGEPLIEQIERLGLPVQRYYTTASGKKELIEQLKLVMARSEIKLLDDNIQKGELKAYQIEVLPSGGIRYNAPSGLHDDTVMALALAWHGAAHRVTSDSFAFW